MQEENVIYVILKRIRERQEQLKTVIANGIHSWDLYNKTVGEFDFVYFNEVTNEHCHLEVAIKYFLGLDDNQKKAEVLNQQSSMHNWLGPNANDRLDKKFCKMVEHQSRLSQTIAGKKALEKLGIKKVKTEICMLGYLFYPMAGKMLPPANSHVSHNRGHWLKYFQLEEYLPVNELWMLLNKPHWLAPITKRRNQLITHEQLLEKIGIHFLESSRPLLISNFKPVDNRINSHYNSVAKYFVVPEKWPLISDQHK